MGGRICEREDIRYYWDRDEIGYSQIEEVYYDPKYNLYYEKNGNNFNPHNTYRRSWFLEIEFYTMSGTRVWLPEQDPSLLDDEYAPTSQRTIRRLDDVINFIKLDIMSLCTKTKQGDNRMIAEWSEQKPCSFAIKSIVENRCMHWISSLDGHCDCHLAQDHASGKEIDLNKVLERRKIDDKKNLPPDHHFEEARNAGSGMLSGWYSEGRLVALRSANSHSESVFYDAEWDCYWNGVCTFLEEITKKRRQTGHAPHHVVDNWSGPIAMEGEKTHILVGVDNSGTLSNKELDRAINTILALKDVEIEEVNFEE